MRRTLVYLSFSAIVFISVFAPYLAGATTAADPSELKLWGVVGQAIAGRYSWASYRLLDSDLAAIVLDAARDDKHARRSVGVYALGLLEGQDAQAELERARGDRFIHIRSVARFATLIAACRHQGSADRRQYLMTALNIETDDMVRLLLINWLNSEYGDEVSIELFDRYYGVVSPSADLELLYHLARSSDDQARERLVETANEPGFALQDDIDPEFGTMLPFLRPGVWPEMGNFRAYILWAVRSPEFGRTTRPGRMPPRTDRPPVNPTRN